MVSSNYQPTAKEEEFEKYHERLRSELNNANWHFRIWKYLREIEKDYLPELNQAPAFFNLTMDAHLLETIMRLNRFFDKDRRKRPLTIWEFLKFVEQNIGIFSEQAFEKRLRGKERYIVALSPQAEAMARIANERATFQRNKVTYQKVEQDRQKVEKLPKENLRKWRNKALAHIQKDYVLANISVFKRYPVKPQQIDQIIDTLDDVLNDYCVAYDSSTWAKELPGLETRIQAIMDAIRFKMQKGRKRYVKDNLE